MADRKRTWADGLRDQYGDPFGELNRRIWGDTRSRIQEMAYESTGLRERSDQLMRAALERASAGTPPTTENLAAAEVAAAEASTNAADSLDFADRVIFEMQRMDEITRKTGRGQFALAALIGFVLSVAATALTHWWGW